MGEVKNNTGTEKDIETMIEVLIKIKKKTGWSISIHNSEIDLDEVDKTITINKK